MIPLKLDEFSKPKEGISMVASPGTPIPPHYNIASKVTETKRTRVQQKRTIASQGQLTRSQAKRMLDHTRTIPSTVRRQNNY